MNIKNLNIFRGFHLRRKIVAAYQQHVDYRRQAALWMWVTFIATFIFLRLLTFGIRYHFLPVKNVVKSGVPQAATEAAMTAPVEPVGGLPAGVIGAMMLPGVRPITKHIPGAREVVEAVEEAE